MHISWACKKQTAVSHSSTKAKVVLLDTVSRIEGLLALKLLDTVIDLLESPASRARVGPSRQLNPKHDPDRATPKMTCASHFSASFFLILEASRFNGSRELTLGPPVV